MHVPSCTYYVCAKLCIIMYVPSCMVHLLYECIANHYQGKARYYNLLPEQNWEIDLVQLDSLIDEKTRAIVINNPSNPCSIMIFSECLGKYYFKT